MSKEAYGRLVDDAKLENVRLLSSSFKLSPRYRRSRDDDIERFVKQTVAGPHLDEETNSLFGMVNCRCWIEEKEADAAHTDRTLFSIDAEYMLRLKLDGKHDIQVVNAFFRKFAPTTAWPYFRVHVANVASEASLGVVTLPIRKLTFRVASAEKYAEADDVVSF